MNAIPEELQEESEIHELKQGMHPKKPVTQTCTVCYNHYSCIKGSIELDIQYNSPIHHAGREKIIASNFKYINLKKKKKDMSRQLTHFPAWEHTSAQTSK